MSTKDELIAALKHWKVNVGEVRRMIESLGGVHVILERQRTPLHLASIKRHDKLAEILIREGANIEAIDDGFWTPLHLASGHGSIEIVRLLLRNGAAVNYQDDDCWTALHQAVSQDNWHIAFELVKAGADPTIRTTDDKMDCYERARDRLSTLDDEEILAMFASDTVWDPWIKKDLERLRELLTKQELEHFLATSLYPLRAHAEHELQTPYSDLFEEECEEGRYEISMTKLNIWKSDYYLNWQDYCRHMEKVRSEYGNGLWMQDTEPCEEVVEPIVQKTWSPRPIPRALSPNEIRMAKDTPYQYGTLNSYGHAAEDGKVAIRMIEFDEKVTATNEVVIELVTSLDLDCDYVAVSYVWGTGDFIRHVLCDGGRSHLMVTEHLYNILLMLRVQGHSRLWIDAICINQADVIERNAQVKRMADIYRRAEQVRVFLGTASLRPEHCLQSQWWSRRWVIQEVVSAQKVYVHSNELRDGMRTELDAITEQCLEYDRRHPTYLEARNNSHGQYIGDVRMSSTTQSTASKIRELYHIRKEPSVSVSIFTHLLHFHDTQCKDPRDRLYAFFGISHGDLDTSRDETTSAKYDFSCIRAPQTKICSSVNYDLRVEELYYNFALAALQSSQPIDILHCAGAFSGRRPANDPEWPSWVPDWRVPRRYYPLMRATGYDTIIPRLGRIKLAIDEARRTVTIGGYRVGIIVNRRTEAAKHRVKLDMLFAVDYAREGSINLSIDRDHVSVERPSREIVTAYAPPIIRKGDIVVALVHARTPFVLRETGPSSFLLICDCFLDCAMTHTGRRPRPLNGFENFTIV